MGCEFPTVCGAVAGPLSVPITQRTGNRWKPLGFPCRLKPAFLLCPLMRIRGAFRYFWPDFAGALASQFDAAKWVQDAAAQVNAAQWVDDAAAQMVGAGRPKRSRKRRSTRPVTTTAHAKRARRISKKPPENRTSKKLRERRAKGDDFRKKLFLGYDNGKKVYSIGRGSIYANQKPPPGEVWEYE